MQPRLTFNDDDDDDGDDLPPRPRLPRAERTLRWLIAACSLLLTAVVPLAAISLTNDEPPELRVAPAGDLASTLIVDGEERVLVLASSDSRDARAVRGVLTRPWEVDPGIIITPADDAAAPGLLDLLRHAPPQRVIVAGLPGATGVWHAVETRCAERGIALDFLSGRATIELERLHVVVSGVAPEADGGGAVVVQPRGSRALVAIALDEPAEETRANLLISSSLGGDAHADIVLTTDDAPTHDGQPRIVLGRRDRARVVFHGDTVEVFGGTLTGDFDTSKGTGGDE